MRALLAAAALLAATACIPEEGPLMAAHQDCLGCHGGGGDAPAWTVAGTFGSQGTHVTVTDANGWSFTLHAARNGNFYTAEKVAFPVRVSVNGEAMPGEVRYGGCNVCHGEGGTIVTGPLMAPGSDCLRCHDGSVAEARFTVAGTWRGPGHTVSVTGVPAMTTNAVGNFYTAARVSFPAVARVDGETMGPPLEYGGCNRCHGAGGEAEGD
jgi:hypothetical protein